MLQEQANVEDLHKVALGLRDSPAASTWASTSASANRCGAVSSVRPVCRVTLTATRATKWWSQKRCSPRKRRHRQWLPPLALQQVFLLATGNQPWPMRRFQTAEGHPQGGHSCNTGAVPAPLIRALSHSRPGCALVSGVQRHSRDGYATGSPAINLKPFRSTTRRYPTTSLSPVPVSSSSAGNSASSRSVYDRAASATSRR